MIFNVIFAIIALLFVGGLVLCFYDKNNGFTVKSRGTRIMVYILGVILFVYALTIIFTLLWGFITSFKDEGTDYYFNKIGLPKKWRFDNYSRAFKEFNIPITVIGVGVKYYNIFDMFKNSLLYAVGCSFFSTLIPCITGYAMAKFRFKFSDFLYGVVLITMALPVVGNLASEIEMITRLGLYDTWLGIYLMSANFAGTYTLVFFATFRGVPNAYSEAAEIDGASEFCVMVKILMPLVVKTFAAIMLIKFIAYWNEYESAMIYLRTHPVISYGLFRFDQDTQAGNNSLPFKIAGCMLVMLPVLVIFLIFQDKLMGNVSMGGIKG